LIIEFSEDKICLLNGGDLASTWVATPEVHVELSVSRKSAEKL